jgi:glutamate racemase
VPLLYVADSAHAPYGERDAEHVLARSASIASHLIEQGAVGLVVACNTATAIAVQHLRERWPQLVIIGVEPGLKPAVAVTRSGRIGVLATTGTLASEKYQRLLHAQPAGIHVAARACPGLARLIEEGDLGAPALLEAVEQHCAVLREADVDTVVLGCTHYAFVRDLIQAAMGPQVQIIDTAEAVARHALQRLGRHWIDNAEPATVRLQTTGSVPTLRSIAAAWLAFECVLDPAIAC